ncbi:hypothetical protein CRUP_032799 [Coryphaenoides rupestris]|nr:hypothetical protein CRUP_032799 [Coryphaenoides rupestris]
MTFYTPEPTVMMLDEFHQSGYGAMTTPNRLVVRSPYNTAQTYSEDFFDNYLLYENEITLDYSAKAHTSPDDPEFSCENLEDSYVTIFHPVVSDSRVVVPSHFKRFSIKAFAFVQDKTVSKDQIYVHCDAVICDSNARDGVCSGQCQNSTDYQYHLTYTGGTHGSELLWTFRKKSQLELILDNCWATLQEERTSLPSWDIIVGSCENLEDSYVTIFHPVVSDSRVVVPSHFKRFSIKAFAFVQDKTVSEDQELTVKMKKANLSSLETGPQGVHERHLQCEGLGAAVGTQLLNIKAPGVAFCHRQNHTGEGDFLQHHVKRKRPQL